MKVSKSISMDNVQGQTFKMSEVTVKNSKGVDQTWVSFAWGSTTLSIPAEERVKTALGEFFTNKKQGKKDDKDHE